VTRERVLLWLAAIVLSLMFSMLSLWQYGRGEQKIAILNAWDAALVAEPVSLSDGFAVSLPRRVTGEAQAWPGTPWLLLDNQRHDGRVGVRAYALLRLPHEGPALLADFGWLPLDGERRWPPLPALPANVDATGLLTLPPGQGLRLGDHDYGADTGGAVLLNYLDLDEISRALKLPLYPAVLRIAPQARFGFERDTTALPNTPPPATHYGYAVQWLALAITVLVVAGVLEWRARNR